MPKNQTAGLNEYWDDNRERYLKSLIHKIRSVYPKAIITAERINGTDIQTITIEGVTARPTREPINLKGILKTVKNQMPQSRRLSEQKSD
eukprot:73510_1